MKKNILILCLLISVILGFSCLAYSLTQAASNPPEQEKISIQQKRIYLIPISGTIDLGLSAFVKRAAVQAKEKEVDAVVLDINTYGGRVDAADEMVTTIANFAPIPTFAYISHSAWSAGALIALACKDITMQSGASIGSAEPRIMGIPTSPEATDEKLISALRAGFKSTAEANGHSPNLAQAMVDMNIELVRVEFNNQTLILTRAELDELKAKNPKTQILNEKIICAKKELLNLTANEALELKLSSQTLASQEDFFKYLKTKLSDNKNIQLEIFTVNPTWSENLVRFLTHPIISPLLLSLGFLGLLFELKMPGWGVSGTLGAIFIVLFFWGHYLVGLADFVDMGIFSLGIVLLFIEVFYIPGFGLTGILGILFIFIGLVLMLVKHPFVFPSLEFSNAFYTLAKAFIITFFVAIIGIRYLPKTSIFKKIQLLARETNELGFQTKSLPEKISIGTIGISKTMLRPSGRALFDQDSIDVTTQGEFIPKDKPIIVVRIQGNKVFVEQKKETINADLA
ncbi:MAG: NfeD family protein [Candidatus Omnitrophota bacterium]